MKTLIVDDDVFVRQCLMQMLPWQTLDVSQVIEASNGAEALEIALREQPELVITDIKMPRMNGVELARRLKESLIDVCVILVSEYNDFAFMKEALRCGVDDYILKPLVPEKLEEIGEKIRLTIGEMEKRKYFLKLRADPDSIRRVMGEALESRDAQMLSDSLQHMMEQKIHRSDIRSFGMLCLMTLFEGARAMVAAGNSVEEVQADMMQALEKVRSAEEMQAVVMEAFQHCLHLCSEESELPSHAMRMKEYIDTNYMDPDMSVAMVSEYMHLSPIYTGVLFKKEMGQTVVSYIHQVRIEEAKRMLVEDKFSIREISQKVGYVVPDYFTRLFSKTTGMTPSRYKNVMLMQKQTEGRH